ncbi:hypothetical protein [Aneurinibacillus aneurinilyticus]|jgi:hypothetical protein|uniref:hypothetical protein n=1 Tax=Aneurinibacillus aneurinilyticus TaxID=1391 RepID=UPI0023F7C2FF|nr:hypothetical protein [Aneurinibacillus aneurinilyticus]MCI1694292.1 hypothetical protein [Aneurinibacillus aneurinilyticus]
MFKLSLFVECQNNDMALIILNDFIKKIDNYIISYNVCSSEPYWKINGWFKVTCDIETSNVLDMGEAEKILEKISSKWFWDKGRVSACSDINDRSIIFFNEGVKFFTCWFEDFE